MHEVRITVKLTNSIDEEKFQQGQLASDEVRRDEVHAVATSKAYYSVIPKHVQEKLGVSLRGKRLVEFEDGRREEVPVTGPILFEIEGCDTGEDALVCGNDDEAGVIRQRRKQRLVLR